jgi:hypothetical protein
MEYDNCDDDDDEDEDDKKEDHKYDSQVTHWGTTR